MSTEAERQKRELRERIRQGRRALDSDARALAGDALAEQLMALVSALGASRVSCFMATPLEPETRPFLARARAAGVDVLLPVSLADGTLQWVVVSGEDAGGHKDAGDHEDAGGPAVELGAFGIEEPHGERLPPEAAGAAHVMLIPAAAVDLSGQRLGWGRGYFDRTLAMLASPGTSGGRPPIYAVVFDHELLARIPTEAHDMPLDGVVTPSRVITFPANER